MISVATSEVKWKNEIKMKKKQKTMNKSTEYIKIHVEWERH